MENSCEYPGDGREIPATVAKEDQKLWGQGVDDNQGNGHKVGVVCRKSLGKYHVSVNGDMLECDLSTMLRKELVYPTADPNSVRRRVQKVKVNKHVDPLAIGDRVRLIPAPKGSGLIVERLPRRNQFYRRGTGSAERHSKQVLAANLDQVVLIFAVEKPSPRWNLLDRYLVTAEASELPVIVVLSKMDLAPQTGELYERLALYERIGYPVVLTSAVAETGIDHLGSVLQGKISVLLGQSGVGKTTLLNSLQPDLGLRTAEVSQSSGKGRHTTSSLALFPLDFGGAVIDTPGVREFGIWDVDRTELDWFFPEMRPFIGQCKFGLSCAHDEEPGCAVRQAVMAEEIDPHRWRSYLRMRAEP